MIKNILFVMLLLSLALAGGCAKGGNGVIPPAITVNDGNLAALYPNQSVTFTATVGTPPEPVAVTWSLTGTACTGAGNPCGTIDPNSGVYVAPAAVPSPSEITITAVAQSNSAETGSMSVNLVQVSVVVTPTTVTVGQGLVQQFTAVAIPDDAPQSFIWTCTPTGSCGSLSCGSNNSSCDTATSDPAVYTAPSANGPVVVTATWGSTVSGQAKVTVAASRLAAGAYAFRFSGYDNSGNPVAAAGSLTVGANDAITGGVEDVVIDGVYNQYTTVTGSYSPTQITPPTYENNLGTLTLDASAAGGPKYTYTAVLTSSGIIRMIESDSLGSGSGVLEKSAAGTVFNAGAQTFAFGFTGVDSSGKRVGYVGLLPMTPSATGGTIAAGQLDINDNGTASSYSNVTGTYTLNAGVWQMALNYGTTTLDFDFFVAGGTAQTKTGPNPLTLYAISTDLVDATHPALSGAMVYQVPMTSGYNNAAFNGTSVSNLTGANANVSLTVGTTDGTSSGTGGAGNFTSGFDQNNNGTIVSVPSVPGFTYTYVASSGNTGRYTFQMLGNPNANPVVAPLPFILYASGANRGFLLDQSSPAVMTGTMDPQSANASYAAAEMPGTYAAATIGNSDSGLEPVAENLLLTWANTGTCTAQCVNGTQYDSANPAGVTMAGAYTMTLAGTGTNTLTAGSPATSVIYAIDVATIPNPANPKSPDAVITDFMMMGTCTPQPPATTCSSGPASSIIFAQQ